MIKSRKIQFLNKLMFSEKLSGCNLSHTVIKKLYFQNSSEGNNQTLAPSMSLYTCVTIIDHLKHKTNYKT